MEAALEREDVFEVYSTARAFESTENPLFESYLDKVTSRGNIYTNCPGLTCLSASTTTQRLVV